MNRLVLYVIAAILGVTLLLFTCTYQVRFNEVAVVTTFGEAGENAVVSDPGLHFKWPYPIQSVRNYDCRIHVLDTRLETIKTKDENIVDVQVFLTWRISDALKFFRGIESDVVAAQRLDDRLRNAHGVFSSFNFSDLLNAETMESQLDDVEARMLAILRGEDEGGNGMGVREWGIEPVYIGISRFLLPQDTSKKVFERMIETRNRLAENARSAGDAEKSKIIAQAKTQARTIEDFARRQADEIRGKGRKEEAVYLATMQRDPGFAIFLFELAALREALGHDVQVILPFQPPFDLLGGPPSTTRNRGE